MMMSNSVVLMRKPTYTSWAMEELLQPWIHYIPLNNNYDDIEEMAYWMLQHPDETKHIIRRANLWILDLYYHKDSLIDETIINDEILNRYRAHFKNV
jgi:Glycosyl transferase family 90